MMSRHASLFGWTAAGILSFGIVANAHAVPIADQLFPETPSSMPIKLPSSSSVRFQQSVTAGLSGLLSQIDIFFAGYEGPGVGTPPEKVPPGEVLFSVNVGAPWQDDVNDFEEVLFFGAGLGPGVHEIDVSAGNIFVNPGDMFVIGLQSSGSNAVVPTFAANILLGDGYPGGALWMETVPVGGASDLNFVTYVGLPIPKPSAFGLSIPEPSGLILLFLGLTGLRLAGMRRN